LADFRRVSLIRESPEIVLLASRILTLCVNCFVNWLAMSLIRLLGNISAAQSTGIIAEGGGFKGGESGSVVDVGDEVTGKWLSDKLTVSLASGTNVRLVWSVIETIGWCGSAKVEFEWLMTETESIGPE